MQASRRLPNQPNAPVFDGQNLRWLANGVLAIGAIVLLLGCITFLKQWSGRTAISSVQVDGVFRQVDRSEVAQRLAPVVTGSYFSVDLPAIQESAKALPWIEEATVTRQWPDQIHVQLAEKQAVARWGEAGLISTRGELFVPVDAEGVDGLPILFGPNDKVRYVMEQYRAMNSILRLIGLRIIELQLTDRMTWFLKMDNGIEIVVDQMNPIEKLQRFAYLYRRQLAPDVAKIASIDLRYRNGVAVGWKTQ